MQPSRQIEVVPISPHAPKVIMDPLNLSDRLPLQVTLLDSTSITTEEEERSSLTLRYRVIIPCALQTRLPS